MYKWVNFSALSQPIIFQQLTTPKHFTPCFANDFYTMTLYQLISFKKLSSKRYFFANKYVFAYAYFCWSASSNSFSDCSKLHANTINKPTSLSEWIGETVTRLTVRVLGECTRVAWSRKAVGMLAWLAIKEAHRLRWGQHSYVLLVMFCNAAYKNNTQYTWKLILIKGFSMKPWSFQSAVVR